MDDAMSRKRNRIFIIVGVFIVIAVFYFTVFPIMLSIMQPKNENPAMLNKFKMLYTMLQMYKSDFPDSRFPTKDDLNLYDNGGLFKNDDIALLGNSAWPAGQDGTIVAVSRTLSAVPCPASYGFFFGAVRGWPSASIPERKIQLHADGKITICPIVDSRSYK